VNEAYLLLSAIFTTLKADGTLAGLIGTNIFVQSQKPKGVKNPVLLMFIRNATESTQVYRLSDVFIDFVVRSDTPDGEGTTFASVFARVDTLVNDVRFTKTTASGRMTRAGLPVGFASFDEDQKDWFKLWRYRVIAKNISA